MPVVEVPGIGIIEFPDTMAEDEISEAITGEIAKSAIQRSTAIPQQVLGMIGNPAVGEASQMGQQQADSTRRQAGAMSIVGGLAPPFDYDQLRHPNAVAGQGIGRAAMRIADVTAYIDRLIGTDEIEPLEEMAPTELPRVKGTGAMAGLANVGLSTAEGLLQNPNIAMAPLMMIPGVPEVAGAAFGTGQAIEVPAEISEAIQTVRDPDATRAQKIEALAKPAVSTAFSALMLRGVIPKDVVAYARDTGIVQGPPTTGEFLRRPEGAEPITPPESLETPIESEATDASGLSKGPQQVRAPGNVAESGQGEGGEKLLVSPPSGGEQGAQEIGEPAAGTVRLYQGSGGIEGGGAGGSWWTADPERAKTYGPNLNYVDVPADVAAEAQANARKGGSGTKTDHLLPDEWVRQAKALPGDFAQKVHAVEEPAATETDQQRYERLMREAAENKEKQLDAVDFKTLKDDEIGISIFKFGEPGPGVPPPNVQVDSIRGGENQFSTNPAEAKRRGLNIPTAEELLKLPAGKYTLAEAKAKLEELRKGQAEPAKPAAPAVAPAAPAPAEAEPKIVGLGAAVQGEVDQPGSVASNMFAFINADRKAMGKGPMAATQTRTWDEDNQRAMAQMNRDPNWASNLVAELKLKPRPLLSWENAGLVWHRAKLKAELNGALGRIAQAFDDGREQDLLRARIESQVFEDQLEDLDKAVGRGGSGSEAGRSLKAQQMGAGEDFSLIQMRLERRAAKGGERLTPDEETEINKKYKAMAEALGKVQALAKERELRVSTLEAQAALRETELAAAKAAKGTQYAPIIIKAAERLVSQLDARAEQARQRIKERMGRTSAGLDPTVLLDVAEIGASHIGHLGLDFAKWSAEMVKDLGDWIKPHLQQAFEASKGIIDGVEAPEQVKRKVKRMPAGAVPEEVISSVEDKIKAKVLKGRQNELTPLVKKLAEAFYGLGVRGLDPMIDALHGELKKFVPEISRLETMDAMSGRGNFTLPNQNAIKKGVRDLSGQARLAGHIQQLLDGLNLQLPKSGPQRDKPSAEYRRLQQQLGELMKKVGTKEVDPETQLASALQSAKTYTRNRIADLQQEIETRERIVKTRTALKPDPELETLRKQLEQVKTEHELIFGKREVTLQVRKAALERVIAEMERKLREGDLAGKPRAVDRPADPELEPLKQKRDALAKAIAEARKKPESQRYAESQQRQLDRINKSIAEREARLASGQLEATGKPQAVSRPMPPELEKAKQQLELLNRQIAEAKKAQRHSPAAVVEAAGRMLDRQIAELEGDLNAGRLRKLQAARQALSTPALDEKRAWLAALREYRQELRDAQKPRKTPEERALQAIRTRIATETAEYQAKIARGDYADKPRRRPTELDPQTLAAKVRLDRLKRDWKAENLKIKDANRAGWQKALDHFVKWERAFKLSSPLVFGKLSSAAITRVASTFGEEIMGAGISKLLPPLAAQAPREGGYAPTAFARALATALTKAKADSMDTLLRGGMDIDVTYGAKALDTEWANMFGRGHGAFKAPVKRFEYELSKAKRVAKAIDDGWDITDEAVDARLGAEAYDDALRAIFMQRGFTADFFNNSVSSLEKWNKYQPGGEIVARVIRFLLPVVRVPVNIVAETSLGVGGAPIASARLMYHAIHGTLDSLPPEVADGIMRQFKKGSLGLGLMAIGYFNAENVGGYNWRDKRDRRDVKVGQFRVGGVDLPRWATHAPWFELMQIGATIRRVKETRIAKTGEEKGWGEGMWSAGFGLVEETPFVGQMLRFDKLTTDKGRTQYLGELSKGTLIPGMLSRIAEATDLGVEKRNPQSIIEYIMTGIPGARQEVPEAQPK